VTDDPRTARQIARGKQKRAGDRSARLANTLMKLPGPKLAKLPLDEDLRTAVDRARAVPSHIARRRAERTLAGELRRHDLDELDDQLAKLEQGSGAETRQFHEAERWRARLIEEGTAALAEFPGGTDDAFPALIEGARRERATGLPRGAARQLFRHVVERLRPPQVEEPGIEDEPDVEGEPDVEDERDED
jgi:ribosome-associated protein